MKSKKKKKTNAQWRRINAVPLAKKLAVNRDGRCVKCGHNGTKYRLHGSHILPEGKYIGLSADLDNIITLCSMCHLFAPDSWHSSPLEQHEWFDKKYPHRMELLYSKQKLLSRDFVDFKSIYEELKNLVI